MATLKQRLYHEDEALDDGDTINIHALYAAARRFAAGDVTDTQVRTAFGISASEWTQLKDVVTAKGVERLNDVLIMRETEYLTSAQSDTLLGL